MNSHKLCFPGGVEAGGAETGDEDVLRNRGAEEPVELAGAEHVQASLVLLAHLLGGCHPVRPPPLPLIG